MGSSSSRMGPRPPRPRSDHRPKLNFSSFLCGGASSSASAPQIGNQPSEKLVLSARLRGSTVHNHLQCTVNESALTSAESSSSSFSHLMEGSSLSQTAETCDSGKCLSESKELVPCLSSASSGLNRTCSTGTCSMESNSTKPMNVEPASTNITDNTFIPVTSAVESINDSLSPTSVSFSSGISQMAAEDRPADRNSTTEIHETGSNFTSAPSMLASNLNSLPEDSISETTLSSEDLLTVGGGRHGSVHHVDVVSISSNIVPDDMGDVSSNEARRNNRRLFWDAFSRRSTRRNYDSSAILSSMEDNEDLGSRDRWLLDISDDLFASRFDRDSLYLHRRGYRSSGRRWHSRSEIREQLRVGFDNDRRQTSFCPSGLHADGRCSCDSLFMHEESSTRASISRIVMLAEALFEVLDEIHRQPVSLSMVSLPAPESVVDSLPVKSHIKHDAAESADDIEQCYICLAEYEEGDKIRVLPCRHEYHMSCIDKWLKEIHGVCPLCRGDVCEGTTAQDSAEVAM